MRSHLSHCPLLQLFTQCSDAASNHLESGQQAFAPFIIRGLHFLCLEILVIASTAVLNGRRGYALLAVR